MAAPMPTAVSSGRVDPRETGGFLPAVAERLGHYVYLLIDPRDDRVFYVGSGTGDRCFDHVASAQTVHTDSGGDWGKLSVIRDIHAHGRRVRIDILRHGLDHRSAAHVVAAVIDAQGSHDLTDQPADDGAHLGRATVSELNGRYGARPATILPDHRVALVRIPRNFREDADDAALYEATRGWWRARQRPDDAEWAFAVHDGVVRAVFAIEGWEPARAGNRWGFRGHRDPDMEARYRHTDVSAYLPPEPAGPPVPVNC